MSHKIVDSHQHVNWHQRDTAGLIQDMDEHGIAYAWLLSWYTERDDPTAQRGTLNPINVRADGSEEGITLQDIMQAKEKYPNRFVVGYCPNPRWPNAALFLRNAHLMHGAKICGEWKYRMLIDDPRCLEIFSMAGSLNMPVVLHLDVPYLVGAEGSMEYQPKWYGGTIENLERAMQACPQTKFIGHAPGFWREISADAQADGKQYPDGEVKMTGKLYRLFETYPNLYADLSAGSGLTALKRAPGHAVDFMQRFSDRLLFGRDYYGRKLHDFLQTLPIDPETRDRIYFKNAEKLVVAP
jgi:predicted TIM-barrel fold metal-dependent hydrolase